MTGSSTRRSTARFSPRVADLDKMITAVRHPPRRARQAAVACRDVRHGRDRDRRTVRPVHGGVATEPVRTGLSESCNMEIIVPKWAKFAGRIVHCRDKCSAARAHDEAPEQGATLMGETDEPEDPFPVALDRLLGRRCRRHRPRVRPLRGHGRRLGA